MSRDTNIICDTCKKPLVHPALLDVQLLYRFNVGPPGTVTGFAEVLVEGDYCDLECLRIAMLSAAEYGVPRASFLNVPQDLFSRGSPGDPLEKK